MTIRNNLTYFVDSCVLNNRFGPQGEIQSRSCLDLLGCGDCGYDGCPEKDLVQELQLLAKGIIKSVRQNTKTNLTVLNKRKCDGSPCISTKTVFQDPGKLRVPEIDVLVAVTFAKLRDDLNEHISYDTRSWTFITKLRKRKPYLL